MSEEVITFTAAFVSSLISGFFLVRASRANCPTQFTRPLKLLRNAGALLIFGTLFSGAFALSGDFSFEILPPIGLVFLGCIIGYGGLIILALQFYRLKRRTLELESIKLALDSRR